MAVQMDKRRRAHGDSLRGSKHREEFATEDTEDTESTERCCGGEVMKYNGTEFRATILYCAARLSFFSVTSVFSVAKS
jgi:hypothetical protein